jgi:hypothetical protein
MTFIVLDCEANVGALSWAMGISKLNWFGLDISVIVECVQGVERKRVED